MLWLWGGAGAFVFAGPRLLVCLKGCGAGGRAECILEFVFAILIGVIGAEGIGPAASAWLGRTAEYEVRALGVFIGLLANPVAPGLVKLMSAQSMLRAILKSLGGPSR